MVFDGKRALPDNNALISGARKQSLIELRESILVALRQADDLKIPLIGIHLNQALEETDDSLNF